MVIGLAVRLEYAGAHLIPEELYNIHHARINKLITAYICVKNLDLCAENNKAPSRNEIPLAGAFLDGPVLARQHACRSQN